MSGSSAVASAHRPSIVEIVQSGEAHAMSTAEKVKFWLPIIVAIMVATVPGWVAILMDLAVVKHDVAAIHEATAGYERSDTSDLKDEKLRLEIQIIDQKVEALKVELRRQQDLWTVLMNKATTVK